MIGLGSNRLSVCRRGGMSVTQAGRGGMEWLGVRAPLWSSPYSAQATAALKAQFSLEQWATIRDYGFAHPEIVPYVNAAPLIGGYVSGAVEPNAAAYPIQLGLKAAKNFGFTFGSTDTLEFSFKKILESTNWFDFLYARQAWNSSNAVGYIFCWTNNGTNRMLASTTSGSTQSEILSNTQLNTWYLIKQDMRSGIYVNNVLKASNTKAASWQSDGPLSIAKDASDRISVNFINVKRNDVLIHRYYPIDNEGTWWDVIDGVIK